MTPEKKAAKLKLLKSDLKDCRNPEVLKKYPNLGSAELIAQLEQQIKDLEAA